MQALIALIAFLGIAQFIIDIAEAAERGEAERILAENGPADFPGILPLFLIKEYSGLDEEPDEAVRKKG